MRGRSLWWNVPAAFAGVLLGLVLLLLVGVVCALCVPSARKAVLEKAVAVANEQTPWDIDLGRLYLSPFHDSPMVLYRAWKRESDLPLQVEVDSLFVGHRGQDTLVCVRALRLRANALASSEAEDLLAVPVVVEQLYLDKAVFHSDSLIASVGVNVDVDSLRLTSPGLVIAEGRYPLHGLRIGGVSVGIDLRETPPDTTAHDPEPLLLAFDVPDGELRDVRFSLTPVGVGVDVQSLATDALVDVGSNVYDARSLDIGGLSLAVGSLRLPFDTLYGNARVDLDRSLITSSGLHTRSDELGAKADLSATSMNLETMRVDVTADADFRGSKAQVRGFYDIDDEAYDLSVDLERVNLRPFLPDCPDVVLAGAINAEGKGFDLRSPAMRGRVGMRLADCVYDNINASGLTLDAELAEKAVTGRLHLPFAMQDSALQLKAQTEHRFRVAEFLTLERIQVDYHSQMRDVRACVAGQDFNAGNLSVDFTTDSTTSLNLATEGLNADIASPMHVLSLVEKVQRLSSFGSRHTDVSGLLSDLTVLDTLRRLIPPLNADIVLTKGSPVQPLVDSMGLDINNAVLSIASGSQHTALSLDASVPEIDHPEDSTALRLPAAKAAVRVDMTEGATSASLNADTRITDGLMNFYGLCTDAALRFDLKREKNMLHGEGRLTVDSLSFGGMELGSRAMDIHISPSQTYAHALRADVEMDEIPLDIVEGIVHLPDIALHGAVKAAASVDGLPGQLDLSAEMLPLNVSARYKPYNVRLSLGETPIVMNHNKLDFNGLPVYAADSTFIAFTGGLDLNSMRLDIALAADSFAPVKLPKGGLLPVYGELATDISGTVTGPLDSIVADVDVTILPITDITYPISKKNLAQVKPHGTVNVRYGVADGALDLGGQINVDDGMVRYSPKLYPVMPFHVDSGSHVAFNGPIGQTMLAVSASQKVKADVQSEDEESRRVDFTTGVRVNGVVDSIGLSSIGFFLEAPEDETITRELASLDEDTREGLAATLLATGMYLGESNVAAQRNGYALSSIVNSRINAAMANSKMGKVVDIDLSSAQTEHATGNTNDLNLTISKSFFKDRFRITVGSTFTDDPEVNKASGLLNNLSAEYKLTKAGNVSLRAFAQRDYNNILEGDLYKAGLGVRAMKEWRRPELFRGDSITRIYGLTADAGVAYRSNNSIGPDLTLKSSIKNLLGHGETFTVKGNGAYYLSLRNRHPGDPKKTDTYKFGVNTSLVFPYLHWVGDNKPDGDTRYMLGYQYENIAGGYGVHKLSGSFTYFIRTSRYVTHAFTPFSLSVVLMKAESDSLLNKAAEYPQLIKLIAGNEFVPSIGYNFIYNNYRSTRPVNTMVDLGVKESGNLINALYCLFGYNWDKPDKPLGSVTFNQFVKLSAELRNKFNITDRVCIATRLFAGANIPLGNSANAPLSEAFYAGGPNGMRAASPYAYGAGNFYSDKYNQNFFHSGDIKLEANFELRFPIVWKLFGTAFVDAGNVWNWRNGADLFKEAGITDYVEQLQLHGELYDGIINNPYFARQIALGTGTGLRLDLDGLVIRLDLGIGIHTPYQTYQYDKEGKPDKSKPIDNYFNIPSALDALRLNFGIGYPF